MADEQKRLEPGPSASPVDGGADADALIPGANRPAIAAAGRGSKPGSAGGAGRLPPLADPVDHLQVSGSGAGGGGTPAGKPPSKGQQPSIVRKMSEAVVTAASYADPKLLQQG